MAGPRLTGLEFHWFGKGQLLATRYQHGEAMDIQAAAAALSGLVAEDAKACFTGAESLRRVSSRFLLDADTAPTGEGDPLPFSLDRTGADRRVSALRQLAISFDSAANTVEGWRRDVAASVVQPTSTQQHGPGSSETRREEPS